MAQRNRQLHQKSDIKKTESQHLTDLKNQEDEINHTISEMIQTIGELKTLKLSMILAFFLSTGTSPEMQNSEYFLRK